MTNVHSRRALSALRPGVNWKPCAYPWFRLISIARYLLSSLNNEASGGKKFKIFFERTPGPVVCY